MIELNSDYTLECGEAEDLAMWFAEGKFGEVFGLLYDMTGIDYRDKVIGDLTTRWSRRKTFGQVIVPAIIKATGSESSYIVSLYRRERRSIGSFAEEALESCARGNLAHALEMLEFKRSSLNGKRMRLDYIRGMITSPQFDKDWIVMHEIIPLIASVANVSEVDLCHEYVYDIKKLESDTWLHIKAA